MPRWRGKGGGTGVIWHWCDLVSCLILYTIVWVWVEYPSGSMRLARVEPRVEIFSMGRCTAADRHEKRTSILWLNVPQQNHFSNILRSGFLNLPIILLESIFILQLKDTHCDYIQPIIHYPGWQPGDPMRSDTKPGRGAVMQKTVI
jgi:hypothetical protein